MTAVYLVMLLAGQLFHTASFIEIPTEKAKFSPHDSSVYAQFTLWKPKECWAQYLRPLKVNWCVLELPRGNGAALWVEGTAQSTHSVVISLQDQFILFHVPHM